MGIFKGVLMRKQGIDKIQLTESMRKVLPSRSKNEDDDSACMVIKQLYPSKTNSSLGKWIATGKPSAQLFLLLCLSISACVCAFCLFICVF